MLNTVIIANGVYLIETDKGCPVSLLIFDDDGINVLTPDGKKRYNNIKEVEERYNSKINLIEAIKNGSTKDTNKDMFYIDEYPVKHGDKVTSIVKEPSYIYYKIKESSKVEYVAGWWILEYPSNYVTQLNPKKTTLMQYKHYGAYKNEFDCNAELNIIKNKTEKVNG